MEQEKETNIKAVICLAVGTALFAAGLISGAVLNAQAVIKLAFFVPAYLILGAKVLLNAAKNAARGKVFDENFLMSISTIGAFIIGEYPEAVAVMLFYRVGEYFEDLSVEHSKKSITKLMDIRPDYALVQRNGECVKVPPETVETGETVIIKPGEKIPLDGIVISGISTLDTKALTGESRPKTVIAGGEVLSGCINQSGVLSIRVTKAFGDSTASKIIELVESSAEKKAPTENFITTFARYYTPVVVIFAVLLALLPPLFFGGWAEWIKRGLVFLVISCPCALVISVPLAFFGGIGAASKQGVLIKGGNYLEALCHVDTVVFDKTGTVTKGNLKTCGISAFNGFSENQVLMLAAVCESFSNHPISKAVLDTFGKSPDKSAVSDYKEIAGMGVSVIFEGKKILAGNEKLMIDGNIAYTPCDKAGTKVYVAFDGVFAGCILIADELKPDSKKAISDLKKLGVKKAVMLTGDDEKIGGATAKELGIDEYRAELLPDEKAKMLEAILSREHKDGKVAFVGDGINDAPALALADIGIAMGGLGSDAAIEAADVVLMTDELSGLVRAVGVARETKKIVVQNIVFSLAVKICFLALGALGIAGMWEAVFGDVGVALIAVLNSMRILKK